MGIVYEAFQMTPVRRRVALKIMKAGWDQLGDLFREKGDLDKATKLCGEGLRIRKKMLGPEHPLVAVSLESLARLYRDKGGPPVRKVGQRGPCARVSRTSPRARWSRSRVARGSR